MTKAEPLVRSIAVPPKSENIPACWAEAVTRTSTFMLAPLNLAALMRKFETPVATAEAMWLARTLFHGEPTAVDHDNVPTAIFANPNVATVGLSEEHARERFGAVDVYKTSFRALKLTLGGKGERTFMKLVVDRVSQKVVGAHMIGVDAGEVIQGVAIAMKLGATKAQFDATIGIHPTAAEEFVTLRERVSEIRRAPIGKVIVRAGNHAWCGGGVGRNGRHERRCPTVSPIAGSPIHPSMRFVRVMQIWIAPMALAGFSLRAVMAAALTGLT